MNFSKKLSFRQTMVIAWLCIMALFGCQAPSNSNEGDLALSEKPETCGDNDANSNPEDSALFNLNDQAFRKADLGADIKEQLFQIELEQYQRQTTLLKEYALRLKLAKDKKIPVKDNNPPSLQQLITIPQISEQEMKDFFAKNKNRIGPDAQYAMIKSQIHDFLQRNKMNEQIQKLTREMEKEGHFRSNLRKPSPPEVEFPLEKFPTKGAKNAKVSIIKISDYLCGHCQNAHNSLKPIFQKYKEHIQFTQINIALRPQQLSGTYTRGGFCAQQQGEQKFWQYHDLAFLQTSLPHDHSQHHPDEDKGESQYAIDKVTEAAQKAGLDAAAFRKCLTSQAAFDFVKMSNDMASQRGINQTPIFIVNNKRLEKGIHELEKTIISFL